MSAIYVYENNLEQGELKNYYLKLKTKVNTALDYMEKCVYYLNYTENNLSDSYSVEDDKIRSIDVETIKEDLAKRISYLRNTVIPEIIKMEKNCELT